ncbi:hypothetical protein [Serratia fonticola]|uniref:hypothetical protein n=1 Tax=Serratia fonticola TaxID=47917 RepID=UPI0021B7341B|nr:hypothetical protein [Serratia fonticola]
MSFSIKKKVKTNIVDDDSGVIYGTSEQIVELKVTITSVSVNSDNSAVAFFHYGDDTTATGYASFTYYDGGLFDEAEIAVKEMLDADSVFK